MRWYQISWPDVILPRPRLVAIASLPSLIVPLSANGFPNKPAPNEPSSILKNPPFCYFASFSIVSPLNNEPDSLRDLIMLMIPFTSLLEIINVVVSYRNIFLWIAKSVAINPNDIKTL